MLLMPFDLFEDEGVVSFMSVLVAMLMHFYPTVYSTQFKQLLSLDCRGFLFVPTASRYAFYRSQEVRASILLAFDEHHGRSMPGFMTL